MKLKWRGDSPVSRLVMGNPFASCHIALHAWKHEAVVKEAGDACFAKYSSANEVVEV